jgi:hypothetical protein
MANNWIPEKEAAEKLRLKPRTLRKKVQGVITPVLSIAYTNVSGRNFQYDEKDIEKVLNQNKTKIA